MKRGCKRKVYTGNPVGTYSLGSKHPSLNLYFLSYNGKYENWGTFEQCEKRKERKRVMEACRLRRLNQKPRKVVSTGLPIGTWKRGDPHPKLNGYLFGQYIDGQERWLSPRNKLNARIRKAKPRYNQSWLSPTLSDVLSFRKSEVSYNKLYIDYYNREFRKKRVTMTEDERRKRKAKQKREERKRYYARNPGLRSAQRQARKRKLKGDWKELSTFERKQMAEFYAFRDVLNGIHGTVRYVIDHIHPVAKGGMHHPMNLQLATYEYNEAKSDKII